VQKAIEWPASVMHSIECPASSFNCNHCNVTLWDTKNVVYVVGVLLLLLLLLLLLKIKTLEWHYARTRCRALHIQIKCVLMVRDEMIGVDNSTSRSLNGATYRNRCSYGLVARSSVRTAMLSLRRVYFFSRHTFSDVGKPTSPKLYHTTWLSI